MPSPFPGMDPYLESPFLWRGFHGSLIGEIAGDLNARLPVGLAANPEERQSASPGEPTVITDIHLIATDRGTDGPSHGVAVLEREADHGIVAAYPEHEREMFIAIRSLDHWDEVVTIIEILSPSNKREGSEGRSAYVTKQRDTLLSKTNLMEIDLLRGGKHTIAAPKERLSVHGKWDCLIVVHRPTQAWHFEYWFNRLPNPLPTVRVPLTSSLPEFDLDLQAVFDRAYDKGPYRRRIDYSKDPSITLDEPTAKWMDAWLRERGLRHEATNTD